MRPSFDQSNTGHDAGPDPGSAYDLIIVGGGPGATTTAVYAARKFLNVALSASEYLTRREFVQQAIYGYRRYAS